MIRPSTVFFIIMLVAACKGGELNYRLELTVPIQGAAIDSGHAWTHVRVAPIPQPDEVPTLFMTMSKYSVGGMDVYFDPHLSKSLDFGKCWSAPSIIENIKTQKVNDQTFKTLGDMTPKWHHASNTLLVTGKTFFYIDTESSANYWEREIGYAVYDPASGDWSKLKYLELPEKDHSGAPFLGENAGNTQRVDLPSGDILLPIYYTRVKGSPKHNRIATVILCSFDGRELKYKEHGSELTLNLGRGLFEPSLAYFQGEYFLTIRNDKRGFITRSKDGLHFEPVKPWTWQNGEEIGNANTQQHWITHKEKLYLVYTRKGANNEHIFRNRAPLFMSEVDTQNLNLIQETERIVVPERGAAIGNFGITRINEDETWIVAAQSQQNDPGAMNWINISKIIWSAPN